MSAGAAPSIGDLSRRVELLVLERQRLRRANCTRADLERNRLELVEAHSELGRALIAHNVRAA